MKRISVGILAHVDAGKTTLTEALLYLSGSIKKLGRVDRRDAFLDTHALERERGITIFSKLARLSLPDTEITILDTPGHADFSAETERTLQVLDYAILVISGTDGVQSHTLTLWRLLQKYNVPCFLFVNKTDLPGVAPALLMRQLTGKLSPGAVDFTRPDTPEFYESVALCSEALLEAYETAGALTAPEIARGIGERRVFPVLFGSALKLTGVEALLAALRTYTLPPAFGEAFAAKVYKIAEDPQGQRLTFLKVTGGALRVREVLPAKGNKENEKVTGIRLYSGEKFVAADTAPAGTVAAVTGITFASPGDGLGAAEDTGAPLLEPVLSYRVLLPPGADTHASLGKLKQLSAEDPMLDVTWDERLGEIRVRLMGEIQLEILRRLISDRFGMEVSFAPGGILYKETIENTVEGVGHFEPLRHYAEVHLILKPGARGSGLKFNSVCREDMLDKNWQRLILTHLYEKTHLGVLTGSPITDMEVSLAAGRAHPKHTEGGDFRQATYRAVRQGLMEAKSVLLEPMYDFTLTLPAEHLGRAIADIQHMSGTFSSPETDGASATLCGTAPVSEMCDYQSVLTHYTRGQGKLFCAFSGYAPCHNAEAVIAETGYRPESDLLNPADSVFCAHGAGFNVKWNEVKSRMHLSAVLTERRSAPAAAPAPSGGQGPAGASSRRDIFAADKELMRIFEATYGPVKDRSDPYGVRGHDAPVKREKAPKPLPPSFAGSEYVLVDGYNVIYSWQELRTLSEESMGDARDALITLLCNYQGFRGCDLILVFDAYRVPGNTREIETVGGISVVYTKEAETADSYIERVSHELAKNHRVRVVTSDGMEQIIILGNGALRVPVEAFYDEIAFTQEEIRRIAAL